MRLPLVKVLELPTPRLLAFFKVHFRADKLGELEEQVWLDEGDSIRSEKALADYKVNRVAIKAELATREHI